jgi:hypothetical protein
LKSSGCISSGRNKSRIRQIFKNPGFKYIPMAMTKRVVGVAIFAFWAVTVSMLTAGLVFYQSSITGDGVGLPQNQTGGGQTPGIVLTAAEIAKHSSASDCWIIINSKVYDVTNYLGIHPGGAGTIAPYCGQDATTAFATKDKSPPTSHSQTANGLLGAYYIGDVNQTISQQGTQQPPQNPPGAGRGGGEFEDD